MIATAVRFRSILGAFPQSSSKKGNIMYSAQVRLVNARDAGLIIVVDTYHIKVMV